MVGLIRDVWNAITGRPREAQWRDDAGNQRSFNLERLDQAYAEMEARREARYKNLEQSRSPRRSYGQTWGGSMTDLSNPAVAAHQLAVYGGIDPSVAFMLGAPGAPDGSGSLVGLIGLYKS